MTALGRSGCRCRVASGGSLLAALFVVALLVAGLAVSTVAPAGPARIEGERTVRGPATASGAQAPTRPHVTLESGGDLHGVLRSTRNVVAGLDSPTGLGLAVTGVPVPVIVMRTLLLLSAGTGPPVSARHLHGHLRT